MKMSENIVKNLNESSLNEGSLYDRILALVDAKQIDDSNLVLAVGEESIRIRDERTNKEVWIKPEENDTEIESKIRSLSEEDIDEGVEEDLNFEGLKNLIKEKCKVTDDRFVGQEIEGDKFIIIFQSATISSGDVCYYARGSKSGKTCTVYNTVCDGNAYFANNEEFTAKFENGEWKV